MFRISKHSNGSAAYIYIYVYIYTYIYIYMYIYAALPFECFETLNIVSSR